jgi:hypothetical protein
MANPADSGIGLKISDQAQGKHPPAPAWKSIVPIMRRPRLPARASRLGLGARVSIARS